MTINGNREIEQPHTKSNKLIKNVKLDLLFFKTICDRLLTINWMTQSINNSHAF